MNYLLNELILFILNTKMQIKFSIRNDLKNMMSNFHQIVIFSKKSTVSPTLNGQKVDFSSF